MLLILLGLLLTAIFSLRTPSRPHRGNKFRITGCPFDFDEECIAGLPGSLTFKEPLINGLEPSDIVIFTGGDSLERRQSGFGAMSAESIEAFANHHGYRLCFLDTLDYDKTLTHKDVKFAPFWHRVFALGSLRNRYRDAKFFLWLDDDFLVPYPETDMLNHYVNLMQNITVSQMLYAMETYPIVLNSGFILMKNTDFVFDLYDKAKDQGLKNNAWLARNFGHEQGAIVDLRREFELDDKVIVMPQRQKRYNFNTFARNCTWDEPNMVAKDGDAFVHFLGNWHKEERMKDWLEMVGAWRSSVPEHCEFPIDIRFQ